jgi:secreted Zn-dependent insulinase-like peptidase
MMSVISDLVLNVSHSRVFCPFTGNSESLRRRPYQLNVDVLDELQTFYQQHYLATDMTLAVQSRGQ